MSNENIREIVQSAIDGNYVQTEASFKSEMLDRINNYLDTQREIVAQSFFEESTSIKNKKANGELTIHGGDKIVKKPYGNSKTVMFKSPVMKESVLYTESAHEDTLALIASNIANMAKDGELDAQDQATMSKVGEAMKTGDVGEMMKHIPAMSTAAKESLKTHIDPKYHQSMGLSNETV